MECNLDTDCGLGNRFTGYQCRHDRGHTCHCGEGMVDCGEGYCSTCCTREDCLRLNNWSDGRMFCSAPGNPRGGHLCLCPEGLAACRDESVYCTDLHTDSNNCSFCGNVCHSGTHCVAGDCVCPEGMTFCSRGSSYCADLYSDPDNCGYCGNVCTGGALCIAGGCRLV